MHTADSSEHSTATQDSKSSGPCGPNRKTTTKPRGDSQPSLSGTTSWPDKSFPTSFAELTSPMRVHWLPRGIRYFLVIGPTCMLTVSPEHVSVG